MVEYIEIPASQLSPESLLGIIEEFITREGTDYGVEDYTLEQKVEQIKNKLKDGSVVIAFDPVHESCTLLNKS